MSLEAITAALLNQAPITAIAGNRISLAQRPPDGGYPAIVYMTVETEAVRMFSSNAGELVRGRIQIATIAVTPAECMSLMDVVVQNLRYKRGEYAGHKVIDVLRDSSSGAERDNDAGVWMTTQDFVVTYYE